MNQSINDSCWQNATYEPVDNVVLSISSILIFCSIFGNILLLFIYYTDKNLRTIVDCIIGSLCCSNLLSTFTAPISAYLMYFNFHRWDLPHQICKVYWLIKMATVFLTALHIFILAVYRLKVILSPYKVMDISFKKTIMYMILVWILSACSGVPLFQTTKIIKESSCKETCLLNSTKDKNVASVKIVFLVLFSVVYLSISVISILYIIFTLRFRKRHRQLSSVIGLSKVAEKSLDAEAIMTMKRSRSKGSFRVATGRNVFGTNQQKKQFKQFFLLCISFILGYTPTLYYLAYRTLHQQLMSSFWIEKLVFIFQQFYEFLTPIMVILGSKRIYQRVKNIF